MIDEVIDITTELKRVDDEAGTFALAAMSVALVNYTSLEQKTRIKEVLSMTAIGAMFEKDMEDAIVLTQARDLVESVDQNALNGNLPLEEACRLRGIPVVAYEIAKKYVKEHTEKEVSGAVKNLASLGELSLDK